MDNLHSSALNFVTVETDVDFPEWTNKEELVDFLHNKMKPYEDKPQDIRSALEYALATDSGKGGFIILVGIDGKLVGAIVMLKTGMSGYVPENLLLFVAVDPELRGQGIGRQLIEKAVPRCQGDIKLHVETDNPAARLYRRIGFTNKYLEMRYSR